MRLAYVITTHKNAPQVVRLISRLQATGATFVLHVSKTAETGFFEEVKTLIAAANHTNVFFCKREDGTHNGFGIVKGIINGLGFLLKNNIPFDYVSLISGQDYPLKPNEEIQAFFEKNNGKQFLDYFSLFPKEGEEDNYDNSWGADRQHYRINRYHFKINGKVLSIPELESERLIKHSLYDTIKIFLYEGAKYRAEGRWGTEAKLLFWSRVLPKRRKVPVAEFEIFGSNTWWSITKNAAAYVVKRHNTDSKIREFFKYTLIPDEMYIQTMLLNSTFKKDCVNNDLRDIEWEGGDGTHPIIFTVAHIDRFNKPSENIFARKFDTAVDSKILDLIDVQLLHYKE